MYGLEFVTWERACTLFVLTSSEQSYVCTMVIIYRRRQWGFGKIYLASVVFSWPYGRFLLQESTVFLGSWLKSKGLGIMFQRKEALMTGIKRNIGQMDGIRSVCLSLKRMCSSSLAFLGERHGNVTAEGRFSSFELILSGSLLLSDRQSVWGSKRVWKSLSEIASQVFKTGILAGEHYLSFWRLGIWADLSKNLKMCVFHVRKSLIQLP